MKGFYIKQTERIHEDSGYKCFDIYDENKKLIKKLKCDSIDIELDNIKRGRIMFEIVDDMIHIWTRNANFDVEDLFTSTFYIEYKETSIEKEIKKLNKNVKEYYKKVEENSKQAKENLEKIKKLYEEVEKLVEGA